MKNKLLLVFAVLCTTSALADSLGGAGGGINAQSSTPGTAQTANFNITGTGLAGRYSISGKDGGNGLYYDVSAGTVTGILLDFRNNFYSLHYFASGSGGKGEFSIGRASNGTGDARLAFGDDLNATSIQWYMGMSQGSTHYMLADGSNNQFFDFTPGAFATGFMRFSAHTLFGSTANYVVTEQEYAFYATNGTTRPLVRMRGMSGQNQDLLQFLDFGGSTLSRIAFDGTFVGSSKNKGTVVLSGGTGTFTTFAGATCTCSNITSATVCKPVLVSTTVTVTSGAGTDSVNVTCL